MRFIPLLLSVLPLLLRLTPTSKLPAIFGDHMVLQQDIKVAGLGHRPMPGKKSPSRPVITPATATAGADGKWEVDLAPSRRIQPR